MRISTEVDDSDSGAPVPSRHTICQQKSMGSDCTSWMIQVKAKSMGSGCTSWMIQVKAYVSGLSVGV